MAQNAWVRIHEHKVQEFIQPGGEVYDLIHDVARDTRFFARHEINNRTGALAAGIQVNRPSRAGALEIRSLVFTRTKYAFYVHEGTDRIWAKNGSWLAIPRKKQSNPNTSGGDLRRAWKNSRARKNNKMTGGKPYFTIRSIRGQASNPFLRTGLRKAMAQLG